MDMREEKRERERGGKEMEASRDDDDGHQRAAKGLRGPPRPLGHCNPP